ncbi:CURVATURE THYLAKOID 1C protein [Nymphaea thermarum]|nr:CURVATURE THYLAKOID 1C protein [Nymphaea thermarum]
MATIYAGASSGLSKTRLPTTTTSRPQLHQHNSFHLRRPSMSFSPASFSESHRFAPLPIRASSSEEAASSVQAEELFSDLKEKWDGLENKSAVFIYGGGAILAVWLSSVLVGAINSVPLLPKIMELVGLGYTGWFVYRYLLFKSSRTELASDIEELKRKIAGSE